MTDTDESDAGAVRMELEPDAIHEGEEGLYVDCPECGSPAIVTDVVRGGRCTGYRDEAVEDREAEDVGDFCTAKLALELSWRDEP